MGTDGNGFMGFECTAGGLDWLDIFGASDAELVVRGGGAGASFGGSNGSTFCGDVIGFEAFGGRGGGATFADLGGNSGVFKPSLCFRGCVGKENCFTGSTGESCSLGGTAGESECGEEASSLHFVWITDAS